MGDRNTRIRRLLETRLGGALHEREWQRLNDEGLISVRAMNEAQVDARVALIRAWRAISGDALFERAPEQVGEAPVEVFITEEKERLGALAQIIMHLARQDDAMEAFRSDRLHGELVPVDRLNEWMRTRSASEVWGNRNFFLQLAMPIPIPSRTIMAAHAARHQGKADQVFDVPVSLPETLSLTAAELAKAEYRTIRFYRPIEDIVDAVEIQGEPGTFMYDLSQLAARLATDYGWSEAEAVTFVLSDYTPRIIPARYHIEGDHIGIPALARIVLTLDPALAPQRVAEVYRGARQEALPGGRVRDLSEKHRLLALFAAHQPEGKSPDELMAMWNEEHPAMQYHKRAFFVRDCRAALARLQQQHEK